MSEMEFYQNLRLDYYIKLQEWWTDDKMENVLVLTCMETQKNQ